MEVTEEMIYAFAGEPEITATDAHAIKAGLEAVLKIVEREHVEVIKKTYNVGYRQGRKDYGG